MKKVVLRIPSTVIFEKEITEEELVKFQEQVKTGERFNVLVKNYINDNSLVLQKDFKIDEGNIMVNDLPEIISIEGEDVILEL